MSIKFLGKLIKELMDRYIWPTIKGNKVIHLY